MMIPNRLEVNKGRPLIANSLFSPVLTKKKPRQQQQQQSQTTKKKEKGGECELVIIC